MIRCLGIDLFPKSNSSRGLLFLICKVYLAVKVWNVCKSEVHHISRIFQLAMLQYRRLFRIVFSSNMETFRAQYLGNDEPSESCDLDFGRLQSSFQNNPTKRKINIITTSRWWFSDIYLFNFHAYLGK